MDTDVLSFFDEHMDSLDFYEAFESSVRKEIKDVRIKVQKTQISFYNRHLFACVSFAKVRRKKDCPPNYIVITFGLNYKLESPRIEAVSAPYPNRWTHHVLISDPGEIDEELMGWIKEAAGTDQADDAGPDIHDEGGRVRFRQSEKSETGKDGSIFRYE